MIPYLSVLYNARRKGGLPIVTLHISWFQARLGEAYPNEASCQLMKHSIAVFQFRLDAGDRYVAPIIANR
jgi:hypothetical protein